MSGLVQVLFGVLAFISSLASISGNVLLLLLCGKPGGVAYTGEALSAALSDLGLGLLTTPLLAAALLSSATPTFSTASCQAAGFLLVLLLTGSAHSQCLVAGQRGAQLLLALRYNAVWTTGRRWVALLFAWLVAAVWAALPLAGVGHYAQPGPAPLPCGPSLEAGSRGWAAAWLLGGGATPLAAACLLAGSSVAVAWRQDRKGTFVCNHLHCYRVHRGHFLRSSIGMLTGPVCLLLCWLPFICVGLYEIFSKQKPPTHTEALSTWLLLSNASLNPWITFLTRTAANTASQLLGGISRYREALRRIFARLRLLNPCQNTALEEKPCPQSPTLQLDTTNHITAATTTTTIAAAAAKASGSTKTLP